MGIGLQKIPTHRTKKTRPGGDEALGADGPADAQMVQGLRDDRSGIGRRRFQLAADSMSSSSAKAMGTIGGAPSLVVAPYQLK